jgi:acetolactate synthase regulatory subunit
MPAPDRSEVRHEFRVEADPCADVLLRIIGPFAVQGALLTDVRHEQTAEAAWSVLEVTGLDPERAELLRLRLSQVPAVRAVRLRTCLALVGVAK